MWSLKDRLILAAMCFICFLIFVGVLNTCNANAAVMNDELVLNMCKARVDVISGSEDSSDLSASTWYAFYLAGAIDNNHTLNMMYETKWDFRRFSNDIALSVVELNKKGQPFNIELLIILKIELIDSGEYDWE